MSRSHTGFNQLRRWAWEHSLNSRCATAASLCRYVPFYRLHDSNRNRMNKQTKLTILFFCILKLTLHLIADSHSGFQSDEFLYIESGRHLAFGYMEVPPLTGLLAFIQNLFHSHSVFVYHIFPAYCYAAHCNLCGQTNCRTRRQKHSGIYYIILSFGCTGI